MVGATALIVGAAPASAQPAEENHLRCYIVSQQTPKPAATVTLEDQLGGPDAVRVTTPHLLCTPAEKTLPSRTWADRGRRRRPIAVAVPSLSGRPLHPSP
ncbi:MAG: hypothetical protein ACRDPC_13005 [Solirubrobacteraceae bacterium]